MIWQKTRNPRSIIRVTGALLLVTALTSLIWMTVPAHAAGSNPQLLQRAQTNNDPAQTNSNLAQTSSASTTSTIAANFYLPTSTLRPIFQSRIDQQVPVVVNGAINTLVSKLPASSQSWAGQMAKTLIQPYASLTSLTIQQNGLAATLRISLYPGDPKPISTSMLVAFSVKGDSTIQVSAQAMKNSPSLVSGPLATFNMPVGQLTSVQTTPDCGDTALALGLRFPVSLDMEQSTATAQPASNAANKQTQSAQQTLASNATTKQTLLTQQKSASNGSPAYVEIPASSLADLASTVGTIPLSSNMSAHNIQVAVEDDHLVVTSDIYLGALKLGEATTLITPTASNGNLAVNVTQTTLSVLIMSFQYNTYNQQIEQLINDKLSGALAGTFTVNSAAIGAKSELPCADDDSLIISGTTGLIS